MPIRLPFTVPPPSRSTTADTYGTSIPGKERWTIENTYRSPRSESRVASKLPVVPQLEQVWRSPRKIAPHERHFWPSRYGVPLAGILRNSTIGRGPLAADASGGIGADPPG